ncbi:MAG TPA: patatin-like phospholipase family protein [Longimicrobiales bacterium]|jgi:NTE family protein|nr:patatin-like phospholipase family protein [Longimicrobiales bacterium]
MSKTILVLGGGGTKGIAHVGAWRAITEAGLAVDEIVGTSIGSLIGSLIAHDMPLDEMERRARLLRKEHIIGVNRWALMFNGIRQKSVFRAYPFRGFLEDVLPVERFDELARPLGVNAVDLETGIAEWFGAGGRNDVPLAQAVYASSALPMFFPPALIDGRHFVDGGVAEVLALPRARERGADLVIGVDVGAGAAKDALDIVSKGMVAIQHRVMDIVTYTRRQARLQLWSGPRLVYIRPRMDGYSTFDFDAIDYFLEEGYRATREVLERQGMWRKAAG